MCQCDVKALLLYILHKNISLAVTDPLETLTNDIILEHCFPVHIGLPVHGMQDIPIGQVEYGII